MKRLILLLDGTWNDAAFGTKDTNIVRLRNLLSVHLDAETADGPQPLSNVIVYERGIGTEGFLNRWSGGLLGSGLAAGIRRAYRLLCQHYEHGDKIFVFGFSRGAYTARSLVGLIQSAGLLTRKHCTDDLEHLAWDYYRCAPGDRLPGVWSELSKFVHPREKIRVACLGIFDTVGALGIPLTFFRRLNRGRFEFHNVELSTIVDVNLHALAIDEQRPPFEASVWKKTQHRGQTGVVEQVWFSGVHGDVGGGYVDDEDEAIAKLPRLDDIPLNWLVSRLRFHFPDFPIDEFAIEQGGTSTSRWPEAAQHDSRTPLYRLMTSACRSIANLKIADLPFRHRVVGRDRHAEPIGEMVHISVLERLGRQVTAGRSSISYLPSNLLVAAKRIAAFYEGKESREYAIKVVDWNGDPIEQDQGARVLELLRVAKV